MINHTERLKITIRGYFLDLIYKGKHTSLYLFHDEDNGTFPIGVGNDIGVTKGKHITATAEVYGHVGFNAKKEPNYGVRIEVIELLEPIEK